LNAAAGWIALAFKLCESTLSQRDEADSILCSVGNYHHYRCDVTATATDQSRSMIRLFTTAGAAAYNPSK
jgi:hypothetical protein